MKPEQLGQCTLYCCDALTALRQLPDESVHCCVTSPPYWNLRDYEIDGQIGTEKTISEYVAALVGVFSEVKRVLRSDGVLFLNLGDSYFGGRRGGNPNGSQFTKQATNKGSVIKVIDWEAANGQLKPKDMCGIPWRTAFAMQGAGWYLRQDIIWHKTDPMPESVRDRCCKSHEYIFLFSKSIRYWWDQEAICEPAIYGDNGSSFESDYDHATKRGVGHKRRKTVPRGEFDGKTNDLPGRESFRSIKDWRIKRSVWSIPTGCFRGSHFATFPEELPKLCILAGCPVGGTVLDPFAGSGTTGKVAIELGRKAILVELNPKYCGLIRQRTNVTQGFIF